MTLADVRPLLARIVEALGTNAAGRLLGADRAQVSRWSSGTELVSAEMGRRIVDLHDVLTRILRVYHRDAAEMWLLGSEPRLGGARPIDGLALETSRTGHSRNRWHLARDVRLTRVGSLPRFTVSFRDARR